MSRSKGRNGGEEFEDDGNYGSSVTADIAALQLISKRIHYGEFFFSVSLSSFIVHDNIMTFVDLKGNSCLNPSSDWIQGRSSRIS